MLRIARLLLLVMPWAAGLPPAWADSLAEHLSTIEKAGPAAAGSAEARAACDALSAAGAEALPRLLAAMDTENPVAANWYRVAYQAIVERELSLPHPQLPADALRAFARDARHSGRARRLALALCDGLEAGFSKQLIAQLIDDPEFRTEAVEAALTAGTQALDAGDSETAREQFQRAFDHARDGQQALRAANRLSALGEQVNVAEQLGLITGWWLLGPFDAPGLSGFDRTFPPEQAVDLSGRYVGQDGSDLRWKAHREADPLGLVNLLQALAPAKEAVGYAYAEIDAPRALTGQLRAGADDNCTAWLNGQKVLARAQWLNGHRLDRFVVPIQLQAGRNTLLVKICQGPQNKDPQVPNNWSLQLRVCDASGKGLPVRVVEPGAKDGKP
jgi:hypothetical protein